MFVHAPVVSITIYKFILLYYAIGSMFFNWKKCLILNDDAYNQNLLKLTFKIFEFEKQLCFKCQIKIDFQYAQQKLLTK